MDDSIHSGRPIQNNKHEMYIHELRLLRHQCLEIVYRFLLKTVLVYMHIASTCSLLDASLSDMHAHKRHTHTCEMDEQMDN